MRHASVCESGVLEIQNRVRDCNLGSRRRVGMPINRGSGSFDVVRIAEDCETFGRRWLAGMIDTVSREVILQDHS